MEERRRLEPQPKVVNTCCLKEERRRCGTVVTVVDGSADGGGRRGSEGTGLKGRSEESFERHDLKERILDIFTLKRFIFFLDLSSAFLSSLYCGEVKKYGELNENFCVVFLRPSLSFNRG